MQSISKIDQKIIELQNEIDKLEKTKSELKNLTPEQQIAEYLHEKTCRWNHTDGCSWHYETGNNKWSCGVHSEYLKRARLLYNHIQFYEVSLYKDRIETIIDIINIMHGIK